MELTLADLKPEESTFALSGAQGTVTLRRLSLAVNVWLEKHYTSEQLKDIFSNQKIGEMSRIVYYLVKDKTQFPTLKSFREAVITNEDRVAMMTAMIKSVGVAQPIIDKLMHEETEKKKVQNPQTGRKSTT